MKKIVLTGGPHTGKTTLMDGLRRELSPDICFVPEPAELLIQEEFAKHERNAEYRPVLPTTMYSEFVHMVVGKSVELEAAIPEGIDKALLDRSLIDNIGYARLNKHNHLVPDIQRLVQAAGYSGAIICDFVGQYTQTAIRPESEEFAHAIHDHLLEAYTESGLTVVHLPPLAIPDRLALARGIIEDM